MCGVSGVLSAVFHADLREVLQTKCHRRAPKTSTFLGCKWWWLKVVKGLRTDSSTLSLVELVLLH